MMFTASVSSAAKGSGDVKDSEDNLNYLETPKGTDRARYRIVEVNR
jgi:hypothetical protein